MPQCLVGISRVDDKLRTILLYNPICRFHEKRAFFIFCHEEICRSVEIDLTLVAREMHRKENAAIIVKMYERTIIKRKKILD